MTTILHHQNLMLSLRQAMGWPLYKPQNDCVAWCSGKVLDFDDYLDFGRICRMVGKDLVYSGWASVKASLPATFTVAMRTIQTVDIASGLLPHAASDEDPIILVDPHADQHFLIDERGSLVRRLGRPKAISAGHRRAMSRIKRTARTMADEVLANNRCVEWNSTEIEPDVVQTDTIVRIR